MREHRPIELDPYIRMMFRELPGAVWTTDQLLCLSYVAGRLARSAVPRAKPGMSIFDVLGTHDPTDPIIARHRAALAGESQSLEYERDNHWYAIFIEQLADDGKTIGCIGVAYDITERRVIEQRLARSEALLKQAQTVAHVGSFEWEIGTDHVTWSDEMHRIYGLQPGEFGGTYEAFLEFVAPDERESTKSALFDALRKRGPFSYEHRIVRKDGKTRILHTRADVIVEPDCGPTRVVGCCWDFTDLKEATNNLERARSLLEATIDATADGILVVDRNQKVTKYNQRFLNLWNIPDDLAARRDDQELRDYVCEQLESPAAFQRSTLDLYEHPERESFDVIEFKDGRVFERLSIPQQLGNEVVGRVWSFRDVTDREKLLRRALFLADATRLLSSLEIEPALDSVARLAVPYLADVCAIDLLRDGEPRRLIAASREGVAPLSPELHNSVLAGHGTIYSSGMRSSMAVPLLVKGKVVGAMTFVRAYERPYTEHDLEFAQDVAYRAALSVENGRLYREAQDALQARDEFLAIAAHEIRGPITSVHLAVQSLKKGKLVAPSNAKVFDIIEREDRRLAQFVEELLDLGRIQSGQIYFSLEDVDLAEVARQTVAALSSEIGRSGSRLSLSTEGSPVGQWDRFRLEQVVTNLLSNAIKFGDGKPIEVDVNQSGDVTRLIVKDHGIGISPQLMEKLFMPFGRAVSTRHYGGLGLGLFIVRTIVEGLGGTIRVESEVKTGTTFTIELPNSRNHS